MASSRASNSMDANFRSPAVETCLQRQLRALKLPLLAGDFARFERRLSVEIRDVSVLNDEDPSSERPGPRRDTARSG